MNKLKLYFNIATLILFFTIPINIFAQNAHLQFNNHTIDNGLSQSVVRTVYVDKQGIAWIGTEDGLNMFNGYSYKVFKPIRKEKYALSAPGIRIIFGEDTKSNLWILTTDNILNKFDLKTHLNYKYGDNLNDTTEFNLYVKRMMLEDHNSDVWFATGKGLYKYIRNDDTLVRYINNPDEFNSIISSNVFYVYEDLYKNIWFSTEAGISMYRRNTNDFKNYSSADSIYPNTVYYMFEDENNQLYAFSKLGIYKYNTSSQKFDYFKSPFHQQKPYFRHAVNDLKGNIWIALFNGLVRFDKKTKKFFYYTDNPKIENDISGNYIFDIYVDTKNQLWVGTEKGLNLYNYSNDTFKTFVQQTNSNYPNFVSSITEDFEHNLWVLHEPTNTGYLMSRFNTSKEKFENVNRNPYFQTTINSDLLLLNRYFGSQYMPYKDLNNNIWFGSFGGGVSQYAPILKNFEKYVFDPMDKNSINPGVWSFCEDDSSYIWISEVEMGIAVFDKNKGKVIKRLIADPYSDGLKSNWITCIDKDKDGNLWVSTNGDGINRINPNTDEVYRFSVNSTDSIVKNNFRTAYSLVDSKNRLWIFLNGFGLVRYDIKSQIYSYVTKNDGLILNYASFLHEDKAGNIWIVGKYIQKYNVSSSKFENFTTNNKNYLEVESPVSCISDDNDNLWIASTSRGICKYSPNSDTLKYYDEIDGLSNNFAYGIVISDEGNLWISTNKGLSEFNPITETFKTYDYFDGLQGNEFNANAFYKDSEGKIYFGGLSGFNCFFPNEINIDSVAPNIILNNLKINDKKVDVLFPKLFTLREKFNKNELIISKDKDFYLPNRLQYTDTLILNYKFNSISFEMTGLGNYNPSENQYRYMLENFDDDWVFAGKRRFVSYTNIPPGEYTFIAYSANSDGVCTKNPVKLYIQIIPPYWQTWWFRLIASIFILAIVYFVYKLKVKQIEHRNQELEKVVVERTKEIRMKNEELELQKEEILAQRDEIQQQRDDIETKAEILRATNDELKDKNEEVKQQNEEIQAIAEKLRETNKQVTEQKSIIEKSHTQITDSITYARRLQQAVLTPLSFFDENFEQYFILYRPKEIVSGDFYWGTQIDDKIIVTGADCTGHGVPGAFMSMLGISLLNQIVSVFEEHDAAHILNELRKHVVVALGHGKEEAQPQEGMDMTLVVIDKKEQTLNFAGAYNSLILISDGELTQFKADKIPVGYHFYKKKNEFKSTTISYKKGDVIYMSSDGYADQFGSSDDKKLGTKEFRRLLLEYSDLQLNNQKEELNNFLENWINSGSRNVQIDDVLVMGLKL